MRTRSALEVHIGPGEAFAVIGTVARNDPVSVIGRNDTSQWIAIRFPPNSTARGWIRAEDLQGIEGNQVTALPVLVATPLATGLATPRAGGGGDSGSGGGGGSSGGATNGTRAPGPTATAGPAAGPTDVVVNRMSVLADGRVSIQIGNRGPGDIVARQVFVQVRDLASAAETLIYTGSIASGDTVTVTSANFRVTNEVEVLAIVDFGNTLDDPNRGNNSLRQTLAPLPTPTPAATPPN